MSLQPDTPQKPQIVKRMTVPQFAARKGSPEPLVTLTAYSAPMARLLDPHCDMLLVGDSVGMALYGMDSTLGVTVEMIINHGLAVMRGSQKALVALDMPFGSYEARKNWLLKRQPGCWPKPGRRR